MYKRQWFAQTMRGIREIISRGGSNAVRTNTTIINFNLPYIPDILSLLQEVGVTHINLSFVQPSGSAKFKMESLAPVSYPHLRAHETVLVLVCRLLLEKKKDCNRYVL